MLENLTYKEVLIIQRALPHEDYCKDCEEYGEIKASGFCEYCDPYHCAECNELLNEKEQGLGQQMCIKCMEE